MSAEEAQEEYMKTLQLWSGYGTTLFNVTVSLFTQYYGLRILKYIVII